MNLPQPCNSTPNSNSTCRTQTISTTGNNLFTTLARPDTNNGTLHGVLAAEGTTVCRVLGHFNLTKELTECGTVTCSVFAGDSDLSCAVLSHGFRDLFLCYRKMLYEENEMERANTYKVSKMFENRDIWRDRGGESVAVSGRAKPSYVFPSENNHPLEGKHGHTNMTTVHPAYSYNNRNACK